MFSLFRKKPQVVTVVEISPEEERRLRAEVYMEELRRWCHEEPAAVANAIRGVMDS